MILKVFEKVKIIVILIVVVIEKVWYFKTVYMQMALQAILIKLQFLLRVEE